MDLIGWGLYALAAVVGLAMVVYLYRRREAPGRGRHLLATLRWAAIALLLLLLFDPDLPAPGLASTGSRTHILLDASLSMGLPVGPGEATTRWARAVSEAKRLAGRGTVVLFGAEPRVVATDSLDGIAPTSSVSRLLPALRAASEAGARRIVVLTDGGIDDAAEVIRVLPGLGIDVEIESVGGTDVRNLAISEVEAASWAEAGKRFQVRAGIGALGAVDGPVALVVRQGDEVVARAEVEPPAPGRLAGATLEFEPEAPQGGGLVRYDIALESNDAEPADDVRSLYVFVDEKPAGVALVSFRPDWEPRFLQPVLEQALGLPVRGFLQIEPGRYLRTGTGAEAGRPVTEAEVRRAVGQAELLVMHGLGAGSPAWARDALSSARRALIFPADDGSQIGAPVQIPAPVPGEWYPSAEVPSSPVAGLLADVPLAGLPPLTNLRPITLPAGQGWAPLTASRDRRGGGAPVVVAVEAEGRRTVVAAAEGFWRWAFRGEDSRQAYRRLWSALGGWLLQEERTFAGGAIRPIQHAAPRDEAVRWVAPGLGADSVAFRLVAEDGETVLETTVAPVSGDTLVTPALAPGHYRYEARAFAGGEEAARAEGPLTIEAYSPEFTRPVVAISGLSGAARADGGPVRPLSGEPLHTAAWPYILIAMLISAEWILRRRWGLR